MLKIEIIEAAKEDILVVAGLMKELWIDNTTEELIQELEEEFEKNSIVYFLLRLNNQYVGFLSGSLRYDYVEGCDYKPVGYLEGIYIQEPYRKLGYGKMLVDRFVIYAKENKCKELASDCELSNTDSYAFHLKLGFKEENRIICFKKNLYEK